MAMGYDGGYMSGYSGAYLGGGGQSVDDAAPPTPSRASTGGGGGLGGVALLPEPQQDATAEFAPMRIVVVLHSVTVSAGKNPTDEELIVILARWRGLL